MGAAAAFWAKNHSTLSDQVEFQTPSAGRWVLQHPWWYPGSPRGQVSNPISGEVGAAAKHHDGDPGGGKVVSNPISGEVGAAASIGSASVTLWRCFKPHQRGGGCCSWPFPGDLAGHWHVSNPISGEVGAAAGLTPPAVSSTASFQTPSAGRWVLQRPTGARLRGGRALVSNPISGEVGAAARTNA